jgi:hypothetical protein
VLSVYRCDGRGTVKNAHRMGRVVATLCIYGIDEITS